MRRIVQTRRFEKNNNNSSQQYRFRYQKKKEKKDLCNIMEYIKNHNERYNIQSRQVPKDSAFIILDY